MTLTSGQMTRTRRNYAAVLQRDKHTCRYCGSPATEVDHVVPWAYSQDNSATNLVACCRQCNLAARDHLLTTEFGFVEKQFSILMRRGLLAGFQTTAGPYVPAESPEDIAPRSVTRYYDCEPCQRRVMESRRQRHEATPLHKRLAEKVNWPPCLMCGPGYHLTPAHEQSIKHRVNLANRAKRIRCELCDVAVSDLAVHEATKSHQSRTSFCCLLCREEIKRSNPESHSISRAHQSLAVKGRMEAKAS